ncbi:MAG: hypothetical protein HY329_06770 [Chloroflexi bacterium]|nr:hypothetical protein [Chloroflexota bacterium]
MARRSAEELRGALGANKVEPVHTAGHGPFGVMQLRAELEKRFRTAAGIGSDGDVKPESEIRREVRFR